MTSNHINRVSDGSVISGDGRSVFSVSSISSSSRNSVLSSPRPLSTYPVSPPRSASSTGTAGNSTTSTVVNYSSTNAVSSAPSRKVKYHNPRRHRLVLARGLSAKIFSNLLLIAGFCVCLYGFSTINDLNERNGWDKRVFNVLQILFTAFIGAGLGSLLNEIGSMMRWPLLSRRPHTLDDVDDLLQLASLSSACGLVLRHLKKRQFSHTTVVSMAFIFMSLAARLVVAFFGFAFNINDEPFFTVQPILNATYWPEAPPIPTSRFDKNDQGRVYDNPEALFGFALAGLKQWVDNDTDKPVPSLDPSALHLKSMQSVASKSPSTVTYTYNMRNFNGSLTAPLISGRTINSSVTCRDLKYLPGHLVPTKQTWADSFEDPDKLGGIFSTTDFLNTETAIQTTEYAESLHLIQQQNLNLQTGHIEAPCGPRCSSIWTFYQLSLLNRTRSTLLVCNSTLSDMTATNEQDATYIKKHNLNISNLRAQLLTSLLTYESSIYLGGTAMGAPEKINNLTGRIFTYERYDTDLAKNNTVFPLFGFSQFGVASSAELATDGENPPSSSGNYTAEDLELWLSGLLARVTASTVAFLDTSGLLPTRTLEMEHTFSGSHSVLAVNWQRAGIISGVLAATQVLAAVLALWYTRDVIVKDKSTFSLSHLLNHVVDAGSLETRKEVVKAALVQEGLVYGTVCRDGVYRLCIGRRDEVTYAFPEGWYL